MFEECPLEFRVTGDLGRPGLILKLVEQSGGTTYVAPSLTSWTAVHVPAPREPFQIFADDESQQGVFAFSQTREMSLPDWKGSIARSL